MKERLPVSRFLFDFDDFKSVEESYKSGKTSYGRKCTESKIAIKFQIFTVVNTELGWVTAKEKRKDRIWNSKVY